MARDRTDEHCPEHLAAWKDFARDVLLELTESIRQHGIIQPLIVRQEGTRSALIAGERRWRAAQELGLATAPAIVRTANDLEVLELSFIENLHAPISIQRRSPALREISQ